MKTNAIIALAIVAGIALIPYSSGAEKGHGQGHHEMTMQETQAQPQTTCPVMGGKINPELYVDANGKRIYVCCQGCIAAVKKNPEKYIKKLEKEGVKLESVGTPQTTCPVMGGKINPELYVDVNGKRIYVCCQGCIAEVKKNPEKYIKKLEEQGVVPAEAPKKAE